jgi:hypothetical protein
LNAQKSNIDSRFNIIIQRATNRLSPYRIIASSFWFCLVGELWIESGLILGIGTAMAQTNFQEWDITKVAGVYRKNSETIRKDFLKKCY